MSILAARELKKYYGKGESLTKALDGVSLDIEKGEFVAIIGASGSGKSTLLNMIGGLDISTSGKVMIGGKEMDQLSADELTVFRRRNIGFIFQNYNLIPVLNVMENIRTSIDSWTSDFHIGVSVGSKTGLFYYVWDSDSAVYFGICFYDFYLCCGATVGVS